jgi:hypothetical protein
VPAAPAPAQLRGTEAANEPDETPAPPDKPLATSRCFSATAVELI